METLWLFNQNSSLDTYVSLSSLKGDEIVSQISWYRSGFLKVYKDLSYANLLNLNKLNQMAQVLKTTEAKNPLLPEYNPDKSYEWQPTDHFHLSGIEFSTIYRALKNEVYIPGGTSIKQKIEAFAMLEAVMREAVQAGVATEVVIEKDPL